MYNWSVNVKQLKKDKQAYVIWHLEQLVNFGLNNEKIKASELKKYWSYLSLDPVKKKYLNSLLWTKKS